MKLKYIVLGIINGISLLIFAAVTIWASALAKSLPDQHAPERWARGETPYAQVSVFTEEKSAFDLNSIFMARVNIDKKLVENSLAPEREGARLWTDAFSAPQAQQGKVSMTTERGAAEAALTVTGGDFFLFHPFELISGCYYLDSDVMHDMVLIDDVTAWQLYGSSNVAGKPVVINGYYYCISGVFRQSGNADVKKVYGASPRIFMHYEGYGLIGGEAMFTCYEACLPNLVTGQGLQIVNGALSIDEKTADKLSLENTARYGIKNRFNIVKDFGMRSVVDSAVVYPYWENAARITEDKSALLFVLQILFLLTPTGTVIGLIIWAYRKRKQFFNKLLDAVKRGWDKAEQKRRNRKSKSKKEPDSKALTQQ